MAKLVTKTLEEIRASKPKIDRAKVDATTEADIERQRIEDDTLELTREWFEQANIYEGGKLIRRGRPPVANPKQQVTLRLDADVLAGLRATGRGWQTQANTVLKNWLSRRRQPGGASK